MPKTGKKRLRNDKVKETFEDVRVQISVKKLQLRMAIREMHIPGQAILVLTGHDPT